MEIPLFMQHGDFCVRNILYGNNGRKMIIDWEDARMDHFPLVDFIMLIISLTELYAPIFNVEEVKFFQELGIREAISHTKEKLMDLLGFSNLEFRQTALLSAAFLCAQNLKKGREKTASGIFGYIEQNIVQRRKHENI